MVFTDPGKYLAAMMSSSTVWTTAVLTVSDRCYAHEREDLSGPALVDLLKQNGFTVSITAVVPDELGKIAETLINWCDARHIQLIVTTGGTGFAARDVTPEATKQILHKEAPGITEAMRTQSLAHTPHGMLSRAVAGIRSNTLIVNLPGSPTAAVENLTVIMPVLPHALALINGTPDAEKHR